MDLLALLPSSPQLLKTRAPSNYRAVGTIRWAKMLAEQPSFIRTNKTTGARARGVSYEGKALQMLSRRYADLDVLAEFKPGPWFEYVDETGRHWCQPDAFAILPDGGGIIYECKYQHSAEAWFQIWRLYEPVLRFLYPKISWQGMEICKWFEPSLPWPEQPTFTPDPLTIPRRGSTAIHIWNPSRPDL
jgi:hypothetical protein